LAAEDALHSVGHRGEAAFSNRAPDVDQRVGILAATSECERPTPCFVVGELLEPDGAEL
jgi:hypothetical protein